ncbi:hypothetical protein RhiTH_010223 [Rhizoctonia solani]
MHKRKVYCTCCRKYVTTETFKAHQQVQAGIPRPICKPRKQRKGSSTAELRYISQRLRRRSSQESVKAHRGQSPPHIPLSAATPPPNILFPELNNSGLNTQNRHSELENIPELDLSHVWEEVMQARAPIVLGDQELTEDFDSNTARLSQVSGDIPAPGGSDLDQSADIDGVEYDPATYGLAPRAFVCAPLLVKVAKLAPSTLSPDDLDTIRDFNHFVRQKTTVRTHEAMQKLYCRMETKTEIPSLKAIRTRMLALSALKPVEYHCCKNSCVCYAGYLANLVDCPYCHTPRLNSSGRPYAVFRHIPLIPQLRALFWNPETYRKLLY